MQAFGRHVCGDVDTKFLLAYVVDRSESYNQPAHQLEMPLLLGLSMEVSSLVMKLDDDLDVLIVRLDGNTAILIVVVFLVPLYFISGNNLNCFGTCIWKTGHGPVEDSIA